MAVSAKLVGNVNISVLVKPRRILIQNILQATKLDQDVSPFCDDVVDEFALCGFCFLIGQMDLPSVQ